LFTLGLNQHSQQEVYEQSSQSFFAIAPGRDVGEPAFLQDLGEQQDADLDLNRRAVKPVDTSIDL